MSQPASITPVQIIELIAVAVLSPPLSDLMWCGITPDKRVPIWPIAVGSLRRGPYLHYRSGGRTAQPLSFLSKGLASRRSSADPARMHMSAPWATTESSLRFGMAKRCTDIICSLEVEIRHRGPGGSP